MIHIIQDIYNNDTQLSASSVNSALWTKKAARFYVVSLDQNLYLV